VTRSANSIPRLGRVAGALALVSLLAACASSGPEEPGLLVPEQPEFESLDRAQMGVIAAAERTSQALDRLSRVETTRTPIPEPGATGPAPPGLGQNVAVSWAGPIAPFLARLADIADYKFRVIGRPPAVPVVVDVETTQSRLIDLLRDAGHQAGARATVAVDPGAGVIEVRYAQ